MANDIDLYNDICDAEEQLEHCITKKAKKFWKNEIKKVTAETKELYPDMFWNK